MEHKFYNKNVKILIFGMSSFPGGIESFIMNYYRNIDRDMIQFDFISDTSAVAYEEEIKKLGGKIFKIRGWRKNPVLHYRDIKKVLIEGNYDIVHLNVLSAANIIPFLVARNAKIKRIIAHSHNSSAPKDVIKLILHNVNKKFIRYLATDFFACSNIAGEWLFGKECSGLVIIPNAIDIKQYAFDTSIRESIRNDLGINGKIVLGHIGRFAMQKNHNFLLDIFHEVHLKEPNSILLLAGDGELFNDIKKKVSTLGLDDSVKFLGRCSKTSDLYQAFDLFLLPSLFEGLPVVAVEAQASGLPCVFSDTISREVDLSSMVKFVSLNAPVSTWADTILEHSKLGNREEGYLKLKKSGYDISDAARNLQKIYLLEKL